MLGGRGWEWKWEWRVMRDGMGSDHHRPILMSLEVEKEVGKRMFVTCD